MSVFKVVLTDRPNQRLRISRFLLAVSFHAVFWLFGYVAVLEGYLLWEMSTYFQNLSMMLIGQLIFFVILRSGLNRKLNDPSLTIPQILFSMTWVTVLTYSTHDLRGILLCIYIIILLFGTFQLSLRGFLICSGYALLGYLWVIAAEVRDPGPNFQLGLNLMQWAALSCCLFCVSYIGLYLRDLRNELKKQSYRVEQQNQQLQNQNQDLTQDQNEMRDTIVTLQEDVIKDELTMIFNRRFFEQSMLELFEQRGKVEFCLALLDLDHFKSINDRFGHVEGDRVLRSFADFISEQVRSSDTFCRIGGEEFALILLNTDIKQAVKSVKRICHDWNQVEFNFEGETLRLSVSAGVVEYRGESSRKPLMIRCDELLYQAKREGRNCVRHDVMESETTTV